MRASGKDAAGCIPSQAVREGGFAGVGLMMTAIGLQSCSEAISKLMTASIPAVEVAWLRYLIFSVAILAGTLMSGRQPALRTQSPGIQVLRSGAAVMAAIFFIMALSVLPMAEVTSISFAAPLLVTVFSIPILKEGVGRRRWAAVAAGLVGVLMIVRPGTLRFSPAAIFPLLSASMWALSLVVTRLASLSDRPLVSVTYAAIVGLAVTSAIVPFAWITPDGRTLLLGLAMGIFATAAQFLTVEALSREKASVLAPLFYGSLVWSILFGYLLFNNLPDIWTYAGAAAIMASGLYTLRGK